MDNENHKNDRARAYPTGDAQEQHPTSVGNGQGFSHQNGRVRRKKRARSVREVKLRYASWNVGTMSRRGRELADVLKRRRINAACLQETKWKGARAREIGEGYKLFYCGSDGKRNGVGIVLDSRLKECVVDVKRVYDRLIAIKLIVDGVTLNLISVYAPQSGCEESVKEKFWEDFDCLLMDLQDSEEVYVGGDFNGHVGKESDGYERVHGGLGFGNRNADGEALLQAACAFDLAITNTWFKKKEEHLITYKSGHHATQIDFFLVRRRSLCCVKNCKVLPGEALVTQHRLILMDFKLSVSPKNSRTRPPPKTRWRMLENDECAIRFRNQIVEKMIEMSDMKDTLANECWTEMARYIRKVAKDVFVARAKAQERLYNSLDSPRGQKDLYRITKERERRSRDITYIKCMKDEAGKVLCYE
ncbi:craniofacial development protein 2-like [Vanessa cardui]|uniref:craniofacial development protein 2-like n=1 Tax=Vanessa cardui TaxID=171605 RepID=UPI001F131C9E|nr:craniofacial development protein 2-like [Vanessa cardui]